MQGLCHLTWQWNIHHLKMYFLRVLKWRFSNVMWVFRSVFFIKLLWTSKTPPSRVHIILRHSIGRFQRAECPCLLTSPSLSPKGSIGTPNTAGVACGVAAVGSFFFFNEALWELNIFSGKKAYSQKVFLNTILQTKTLCSWRRTALALGCVVFF